MFYMIKNPTSNSNPYRILSKKWLLVALFSCSWLAHSAINIPDVTSQQLNAQYWQAKLVKDEGVSMNKAQVQAFNQDLFATNSYMV